MNKTKYRCVYKNEDTYIVNINWKKHSKKKEFKNIMDAAKYHDYFKIKYWKYKINDKRLNFPTKINDKRLNFPTKINEKSKMVIVSVHPKKRKNNFKKPTSKKQKITHFKNKVKRTQLPSRALFKLLKKQNFTCSICGKVPNEIDQDHILSIDKYNNDDVKNRQILCIPCHTWKSRYIDSNNEFNNCVKELMKHNLDDDQLYSSVIQKLKYVHSLKSSKCYCKFDDIPTNNNNNDINNKSIFKKCLSFFGC